ncbi:MAG TPA: hypothetical protein VFM61_02795, partial [Pseudidiomarina sp.]|nr:hypothetical protein [Pseudidiomarina sp.]
MSSVLKALRQQSSSHIPPRSVGQLTSAPVQRTSLRRVVTGSIVLALAACAGVTGWWLAGPAPETSTVAAPAANTPAYTLGSATVIRVPKLTPDQPVVDTGTRIEPRRVEPQVPEQPEAVDLDTVSPELLSAFEDAIAATGSDEGEATSVV